MCNCKGGGCPLVRQLNHVIKTLVKQLRNIQKMGIPHIKKIADALEDALTCELQEDTTKEENA